jgi:hypothetical protein
MKTVLILLIIFLGSCVNKPTNTITSMLVFERIENEYESPSYKAEIFSNGMVKFSNLKNIKNYNALKINISDHEFESILTKLKDINFSNLKNRYIEHDECPSALSTAQSISITYYEAEMSKTILYEESCSGTADVKNLDILGKMIDKAINKDSYYYVE